MSLQLRWIIGILCAIGYFASGFDMEVNALPSEKTMIKAEKSGDGRVREDLAPLVKRLPVLASVKSVRWASGAMGSESAPGPSIYWIDAIIYPDEALLQQLTQVKGFADANLPTEIHPSIVKLAPKGRYQESPELNALFSHGSWKSRAYFEQSLGLVVLVALGES